MSMMVAGYRLRHWHRDEEVTIGPEWTAAGELDDEEDVEVDGW